MKGSLARRSPGATSETRGRALRGGVATAAERGRHALSARHGLPRSGTARGHARAARAGGGGQGPLRRSARRGGAAQRDRRRTAPRHRPHRAACRRPDQAMERFGAALEADPDSPQAHHAMAMVLERRGSVRGSSGRARSRGRTRAATSPSCCGRRRTPTFAPATTSVAIELLRAAAEIAPDPRTQLDLAMALERTGSLKEAAERYRDAPLEAKPGRGAADHPPRARLSAHGAHRRSGDRARRGGSDRAAQRRGAAATGAAARVPRRNGGGGRGLSRAAGARARRRRRPRRSRRARRAARAERSRRRGGTLRRGGAARPENADLRLRQARALLRGGPDREARARSRRGARRVADAGELSHQLARVLAASEDDAVRDGARSLELALAAFELATRRRSRRDGGDEPRRARSFPRGGGLAASHRRAARSRGDGGVPEPVRARLRSYEAGKAVPCSLARRDDARAAPSSPGGR